MRTKLTKTTVEKMPEGVLADTIVRGFVARRLPSGSVGYYYRVRIGGKQKWLPLGMHGAITVEQARKLAQQKAGSVASGESQEKAKATSLNSVLDKYLDTEAAGLRSRNQIERAFNLHVRPKLGSTDVYSLKRSAIADLLDGVAASGGPVAADKTLAFLRSALNWLASRDDDFASPIVRRMAKTKPKERARERVLSDAEIRLMFEALDSCPEVYSRFVKFLLLTACRRTEASELPISEIVGDVWTLPSERSKNKVAHDVPLVAQAKALIGSCGPYVFSTTGGERPISGFSKFKARLDREMERLGGPVPQWQLHDLRRTARSLMARAGVPQEHAERVLNHVIPGVAGTYNRHEYLEEKRVALTKLASLIERIIAPSENVVAIRRG